MHDRKVWWLAWLLPCVWLTCAACSDSHGSSFGSESNWLRACHEDSDCNAGGCVCGVCSADCNVDGDCPSGSRCKFQASALYAQTCGVDLNVHGLCAPECKRDPDCGAEQACIEGACAPATAGGGDAGAGATALTTANPDGGAQVAGARQLLVDAHLDLTPACAPDLEHPIGSGAGVFDIGGITDNSNDCNKPYMLALRVRNLTSELVLATKVQVLLFTLAGQILVFKPIAPPLPNPFELSITGSVPAATAGEPGVGGILAEAIPTDYAGQLGAFAGSEVAIRAQVEGETLSGTEVRSNAFEYRVTICDHCLIQCLSEVSGSGQTIDAVVGGKCDDRAAADGRYCFDSGC